jgi:hypothetical protein
LKTETEVSNLLVERALDVGPADAQVVPVLLHVEPVPEPLVVTAPQGQPSYHHGALLVTLVAGVLWKQSDNAP